MNKMGIGLNWPDLRLCRRVRLDSAIANDYQMHKRGVPPETGGIRRAGFADRMIEEGLLRRLLLPAAVAAMVVAAAAAGFAGPAAAGDAGQSGTTFALTIKNHKFIPDSIEIPAKTRVKLVISNQDATAEEFDSDDLEREKVIGAGQKGVVFIGPLDPGTYHFVGEYHEDTAKGRVVVK